MFERKYTYIDLYYNEEDQADADKRKIQLEKLGYVLECADAGAGKYDYCDQFHRYKK
jgi:hypothetical protein